MINSLRKKFILISVLTTTFVIFTVFFTINILNYFNVISRSDEILDKVRNDNIVLNALIQSDNDNGRRGILAPDRTFYGNFFVAEVEKNKIIKVYNTDKNVSNDYSNSIAQEVIVKGTERGFIDHYRYAYVENDTGNYLVFVDCERDLSIFYAFLKNSAVVALTIICAVSFSVTILSRRVLAPMKDNYQKQKQFITDASHELKTPLTIIRSNADVLGMEIGSSKWLTNIHNQIERLTNLINGLVAFSRVEERDNLQLTTFSFSNLLEQRVEEFSELASYKSKKIEAHIEKNILCLADLQSLTQVIDILLENAIKYATNNTTINVNLYKNKKVIHLLVRNYAEDLKQGDLDKVFDRFYRLDESRNSEVKGFGIGLSMAKLIIDKHNGNITACAPQDNEFLIEIKLNA